jgi:hypothetical protein
MENTVVVLGSATPSMESFYNVQKRKYTLLEMPTRADDKKMPIVRVIDMRQEARKEKGTPSFPQIEGSHHEPAREEGAGHAVPESAGLLDFIAVSPMRLCGGLSELQRVAHLSSAQPKALLPHLRQRNARSHCLSGTEMPQPGDSLLRRGHRTG